jgi:hypothetical protein
MTGLLLLFIVASSWNDFQKKYYMGHICILRKFCVFGILISLEIIFANSSQLRIWVQNKASVLLLI